MIYPKEEYGSVYQIPFDEYYKNGYRAIIFDIDNTLVPHGAPADRKSIQLCERLKKMGFKICQITIKSGWNRLQKRWTQVIDAMQVNHLRKDIWRWRRICR